MSKARSSSSRMSAAITAGMPIMIMPAVTSMYQAKIGMRGERHARRARLEDADDELDGRRHRGDLDEAEPEDPDVGVDAGRVDAGR